MISRRVISLLLIAAAAWMSPWKLVCSTECQMVCCRSAQTSEPDGACCMRAAPSARAGCCHAVGNEEAQPGPDTSAAGASCCAASGTASEEAAAPPCCLFVPINPCDGCDLLELCLWAPWKSSPVNDVMKSLERMGAQRAIASIPLPRAERVLNVTVPRHPPWTPRVGEFLSRICVLTI